MHKEQVHCC